MEFGEIKESELEDLLRLYEQLHESDLPRPEPSAIQQIWTRIQKSQEHFYFGAYEGGSLVATCTLSVIPNLTSGCRPYGVIENVVTDTAFRRRGIGKAILEYAMIGAWKRGCYKVMLLTGRLNESTFRFYDSAGFDRHSKQAFLAKPPNPIEASSHGHGHIL